MKVIPFVIAAAAAGCYTQGDVGYGGGAYVAPAPALVYAGPGVQVIADYDEPIFFSDGLYWRSYGGVWYSSTYYTGGWIHARPPVALLRIDRPYAYRHYRPVGWGGGPPAPARVAGGPGWRGAPPAPPAAGLRGAPPPAPGGWRGAPPPAAVRAPAGRPAPVRAAPPARRGWRR